MQNLGRIKINNEGLSTRSAYIVFFHMIVLEFGSKKLGDGMEKGLANNVGVDVFKNASLLHVTYVNLI
jgi:hypothetical protein